MGLCDFVFGHHQFVPKDFAASEWSSRLDCVIVHARFVDNAE